MYGYDNESRTTDPRYIEPGRDITSLPASVRARFERAEGQASRDRAEAAMAMMQQAQALYMAAQAELARSSPELFGLLHALPLGCRQYTVYDEQYWTETTPVDRHFLGIRVGSEPRTTYKSHISRRTIFFS
jgi:hypothetical protein